ncbi:hypothetical protein, conserved [Eimeria acervulina]|uniref:Uncharacterized protein n=1 Tax=Eimeria acervulina TaxID=5801 RepID=U6GLW8_EIMAC|nr:hypothetical protein, conserved [Eimeria acervulina]CDI81170.1 hypothetical protein, conserved [Eimeria acervulina]
MIDTIDALTQLVHSVRRTRAVDVTRVEHEKTQQKLAGKQRVEPPLIHAALDNHRRTRTSLFLRVPASWVPTFLQSLGSRGSGSSELSSSTLSAASNAYGCDTQLDAGPYMQGAFGSNPAAAPTAAKQPQHLVGSQGIGSAAAAAPCAARKTLNGTTINCEEAEAIR